MKFETFKVLKNTIYIYMHILSLITFVRWKQIQHISESVFMGMCLIAGTSQQVAIRRETNDIIEMELILVKPYEEPQKMLSGSKKRRI